MLKLRRPPCFSQLCAAQRASSAAPGGPMACSASREAEAGRVSASRAGGHAPRTGERVARESASRACFCVTSRFSECFLFFESAFVVNNTNPMVPFERSPVAVAHTHTPHCTARPPAAPPRRERDEEMELQRRRSTKHVWEGSVVRHAARRFSLSGTAPPLRGKKVTATPVSYTHLTLPTILLV